MDTWSVHHLEKVSQEQLGPEPARKLRLYSQTLMQKGLPVIFTLRHLARITGIEYKFLRATVDRDREAANHRIFNIKKRSGGLRLIHVLCNELQATQQFLNTELLQNIPVHTNAYAFHKGGGIRRCALVHCGTKWIFRFDIDNFFYRINEADVYQVFHSLGYRPLLCLELARLCTTTYLPTALHGFLQRPRKNAHYSFYHEEKRKLGVLAQGAPTSPMLSNLAAWKLDNRLSEFALQKGFVVTRYADDITLSAGESLPSGMSVAKIVSSVVHIIRQSGYRENAKKTRVAGPGSKKLVLGLLVDGDAPRISKQTYKRIERHLHASSKYGLVNVANHEKFDSPFGFYNHLRGLITYVNDVDSQRGAEFREQFDQLTLPW